MAKSATLSVSQLTQRIQRDLSDYGPVVVTGELSQVKVSSAGHCYCTLKDSQAVLPMVLWRSTVTRRGGPPSEGEQVEVRGTLDVYPPRGAYQLIATRVTAAGKGDLAAQFEHLKAELLAAGWFEDERKQALPWLPRAVGLATADGSAALADMQHSLAERFPTMMVMHAPCHVQGPGAAESIVAALETLDADPDVDVIICGRGGGSLEDLWAFNERAVVEAIGGCQTPVISAVGHETDATLADLVADYRAKTPTAAGEVAVPVFDDLVERLDDLQAQLDSVIDGDLQHARLRLSGLAQHRALAGPEHQLAVQRQRLDERAEHLHRLIANQHAMADRRLSGLAGELRAHDPVRRTQRLADRLPQLAQRLQRAAIERHTRGHERLRALVGQMEALSPLAVIARGYGVIRDGAGNLVRESAAVQAGDPLQVRLADGWIDAEVTGQRAQRLREAGDVYRA